MSKNNLNFQVIFTIFLDNTLKQQYTQLTRLREFKSFMRIKKNS